MSDEPSAFLPATLIMVGAPPAVIGWPEGVMRQVLLEPEAALLTSQSSAKGAETEIYETLPLATTQEQTQGALQHYNLPGLRSLNAPTEALKALLPGLQPRFHQEVALSTLPAVLEELETKGPLPDPLQLDLWIQGSERLILETLAEAGALSRFARIRLRVGQQLLFETGHSLHSLVSWAGRQGFFPATVTGDDPLWFDVVLEHDAALSQGLAALRDGKPAALQAELDKLRADHAEQASALAAADAALAAERDSHASALAAAAAALAAERDSHASALAAADAALAAERDNHARALAAANAKIEDLEKSQQPMLTALEQAKADLSVALRVQDAMSGDLEDLRARYRHSEDIRTQQLALLQQLTPRLQQAATEVRHLMQTADPGSLSEPESVKDKSAEKRAGSEARS